MKFKLFISQPMNGRSDRSIREEREVIAEAYRNDGWEIIDSILNVGPMNAIEYLAESIKLMNDADRVLMMKGWAKARGCRIEHEIAIAYGKEVVYE